MTEEKIAGHCKGGDGELLYEGEEEEVSTEGSEWGTVSERGGSPAGLLGKLQW